MREVRLRFGKIDNAKYIGHLDINRAMSRAIKRANIPIWYTEGYNPRPWMSFSLPLSLGIESICESVDLRIIAEISDSDIKNRLNDTLPPCIRIYDVYDEFLSCSDIVYSDYEYIIEYEDNDKAFAAINDLFSSEKIIALKKGKQGKKRVLKETDIKPFIISNNVVLNDSNVTINVRLLAGTEKNLNPSLLFDTILKATGDYEWKSIKRTALLDKDFNSFK